MHLAYTISLMNRLPYNRTDIAYIEAMQSIFPNIVIAIRGSLDTFNKAQNHIRERFNPLEVFHLRNFLDPEEDDGVSYGKYRGDVEALLAYYETFVPTRANLNIDAELFAGTIERTQIEETFVVSKRVTEELFTHPGTKWVKKVTPEEVRDGGHTQVISRFFFG